MRSNAPIPTRPSTIQDASQAGTDSEKSRFRREPLEVRLRALPVPSAACEPAPVVLAPPVAASPSLPFAWTSTRPSPVADGESMALHAETHNNLFWVTNELLVAGAVTLDQIETVDPDLTLKLGALALLRSLTYQWKYEICGAALHLPYTFKVHSTLNQRNALSVLYARAHAALTYIPQGHAVLEQAVREHILSLDDPSAPSALNARLQPLARELCFALFEQAVCARQHLGTALRLAWPDILEAAVTFLPESRAP